MGWRGQAAGRSRQAGGRHRHRGASGRKAGTGGTMDREVRGGGGLVSCPITAFPTTAVEGG